MGNVQTILNIMRKFTPKGQVEALQILQENRAMLSRELGFAELPQIIAGHGKTVKLEQQLINTQETIRSIITKELEKLVSSKNEVIDTVKKLDSNFGRETFFYLPFESNRINILENNFQEIRNNLLKLVETDFPYVKDYGGKKSLLEAIKITEDPHQLNCDINNLIDGIENKHRIWMHKIEELFIKSHFKSYNPNTSDRKILCQSFEIQQAAYQLNRNVADDLLKVFKAIVPKTKDKEVIEIETRLKKIYNLDFVRLYDIENAQKAERVLEFCVNRGVELPKNYIVTPLHFPSATLEGRHLLHNDGTSTIILNPNSFDTIGVAKELSKNVDKQARISFLANKYIYDLNQSSTNHPLHTPIHEILHGENNWFTHRNIPANYKETVDKLTTYAKESALCGKTKETFTELRTEEVINGILSPDKKQLANYLA